jgi:hypothetical protein
MAVLSNDILSSTLRELIKDEVDQLFKTTPLLDHMNRNGGVRIVDGGQKVDQPLILSEHSSITQLSSGYEPTNLAVKDVLQNATFDFADYVAPVVITRKEELSNSGPRAIVDIAEARLKSVMGMFKREWEKQAVAGNSTVMTEMLTLNGNTPTGFLEPDPVGSQGNSVGGLSKTTFPDLQNQYVTASAGFTGNATSFLTELFIAAQQRTPDTTPDLILASESAYKLYKLDLFAKERYISEQTLDSGKLALAFHGAMMYVDPNMPVNPGGGDDEISMYVLNTKHIKVIFDSRANFTLGDFQKLSGYTSRSADVMLRTQLSFDHLLSSGVLANAES